MLGVKTVEMWGRGREERLEAWVLGKSGLADPVTLRD